MHVEAHVHGRPRLGEICSGDSAVVVPRQQVTWVALIDGLGHGRRAAEAAELASEAIAGFDADLEVEQALLCLHERLRGSRGACAALARFDEHGVTLAGVGNVAVRALEGEPLPYEPVGGVIGASMRPPRTRRIELQPRTRLLFYTDGIRSRAPFEALAVLDGEAMCAELLERYSHAHDDATLIHVTYLG